MDGVGGTTHDVSDGILPMGTSYITTEAGGPESTGGTEFGPASDTYPFTRAAESTCRGVFAVVGGDGVSVSRTSVADTAVAAKDAI